MDVGAGEDNPSSLEEIMDRSDRALWIDLMQDEYDLLMSNKTWILVDKPLNFPVVKCNRVFTEKRDKIGNVDPYKSRLVAKGFCL